MSLRVLLLAAILIPLNSLWMMTASLWNAGYPTTVSLYFNAILYLFLLVVANAGMRAFAPRKALSARELVLIYTMTTVASALNGLDMLQLIGAMIAGPNALATPENDWQQLFVRRIPSWLLVADRSTLEAYMQGGSSLYVMDHLRRWAGPVLIWSLFTISLMLLLLGLTLMLSSRWVSEERLSYPIIQLPLNMIEPGFLRNGLIWAGVAIGGFMGAVNGLHFFIPALPTLGRPVNVGVLFSEKPWNAIGWLPVAVQPFAVGLAFFIPVELSFSSWFFYFFWKLERVAAAALGVRTPGFPFIDEQTTGAYVGFALVALWMARKHIRRMLRLTHNGAPDGFQEMSRLTVASLALGGAGILVFGLKAGMGLFAILLFFGMYALISISVGRIRAELGSPVHDLHFSGPGRMMVSLFGSRAFSATDLTIVSLFWFFNRAYRSHPMPTVLEGFKLGERTRTSPRSIYGYVLFAAILGTFTAFWAHLQAAYRHGAGSKLWPAYESFNRLTGWLNTPAVQQVPYIVAFALGSVIVVALTVARTRFIWFPLHPVGFVVSSSWAMNPFWFSIFLSWAIKTAVLKYGGLRLYRRSQPLFLGIILGEFLADSASSLAGTLFNVRTYIWYG